jgi:hypothetical protein
MLDAALHYANNGLFVFPLHSLKDGRCTCGRPHCPDAGKHPRTPHGFKDATVDKDQIRRWWSEDPHGGIGIATGKLSNLVVLDVDGENGRTELQAWGTLPATREVRTGRPDGGTHLWFRPRPGTRVPSTNKGALHTRGEGGYVVAPPSQHASGQRYRFVNDRVPIAACPQQVIEYAARGGNGAGDRPLHNGRADRSSGGARPWSPAAERELISALQVLPSENREDWLKVGLALWRTGWNSARGIWDDWSMTCPEKYRPDDSDRVWNSFDNGYDGPAISVGSIYDWAIDLGWQSPGEVSPSSEVDADERPLLQIRPYRCPAESAIPPRQHLFGGKHFTRKTVGATIGAGGRAKTTLAIVEAIGMAIGRNLFTGATFDPLRVLVLNAEENQDELDRRVRAACKFYDITDEQLGDRLFVQAIRPLRLVTLVRGVRTINQAAMRTLRHEIKRLHIDVWFIDPLISFHSVRESDNDDMDMLFKEVLNVIAEDTDSHGEALHHPGKPKPGEVNTQVEDSRGASAIIWAVRAARVANFMTKLEAESLNIDPEIRHSFIRIVNGKANLGPIGAASWMRIAVQGLANGDDIAVVTAWTPELGVALVDSNRVVEMVRGGKYRHDPRAENSVTKAIMNLLQVSAGRAAAIYAQLLRDKVLVTEARHDGHRKLRQFVAVATVAHDWRKPFSADAVFEDDE